MSFPRRLAYRGYRATPSTLRTRLVRWLTPNFTLGAVVLLYDERNRLLLVRKKGEARWSLPGGLLNRRERPAQTACRELREETGITVEAVASAQPNALVYPEAQQVDMVFTATINSSVQTKPDGVEIAHVEWHEMDHLPQITNATARLLAAFHIGPYVKHLPEAPDSAQALAVWAKQRPE